MNSQQYLIFSNAGEIDPRLITTLGVNVKEQADSAIGFFGTGLKYALATTLRLGCRVEVQSGLRRFRFETKSETLRGKTFQFIEMIEFNDVLESRTALGFTTELGRQWLPWMAYREFECNCMDERGTTAVAWAPPDAEAGLTRFIILGEPLVQEHFERGKWLLQSQPTHTHAVCDLHPCRGDKGIFYRGIRVYEHSKAMLFTYNLQAQITLTEDRTLPGTYNAMHKAVKALAECPTVSQAQLEAVLTARQGFWEQEWDWDWSDIQPTQRWIEAVVQMRKTRPASLQPSARQLAKRHAPHRFEDIIELYRLSKVEQMQLQRAIQFLRGLGFEIRNEVRVVQSLGEYGTIGRAKLGDQGGPIWLCRDTFSRGTKQLAGTLLEEWLHLELGLDDCSRELQNWLLDRLCSLGEEVQGEPL